MNSTATQSLHLTAKELDWLASPPIRELLRECSKLDVADVAKALKRQGLEAAQQAMLFGLSDCRKRAIGKLAEPDKWWLSRRGLEQASSSRIGHYKAQRVPESADVVDVCSGIGADTVALLQRGPVQSIDSDPTLCRFLGLSIDEQKIAAESKIHCREFEARQLAGHSHWHIDPDRRSHDRRTTSLAAYAPSGSVIEEAISRCPNAMVKVAPASEIPMDWTCQREWIGERGECKQQLLGFGDLRRSDKARRATVLHPTTEEIWSLEGDESTPSIYTSELPSPGDVMLEPHNAVFASNLLGELSTQFEIEFIGPKCGYAVGKASIPYWAAGQFEVLGLESLDRKKIQRVLHRDEVGQLEIKKRGVPADWLKPLQRLKLKGKAKRTIMVFPWQGRVMTAICERLQVA